MNDMARYVLAVQCAETISEKLNIPLHELVDIFYDIPSADVQEVRHGKWIGAPSVTISANNGRTIHSTIYKWSLCNKTNGRKKKPYCPNCGARMEDGRE